MVQQDHVVMLCLYDAVRPVFSDPVRMVAYVCDVRLVLYFLNLLQESKMKKYLLFVLVMIMMLAVCAVSADDLSDVRQAGVLRFGAPLEYIPFVFEDESGSASGMDVALMEEVCRRMGVRMQKLSFARDGIIDALNIGQIDVIGGGLSKTDARAQRIDFTRTYYNGEAQFIALNTLTKPQTVTLDSFRGMRIGVVKGSSFQDWVQNNLVNSGIIPLTSVFTYSDSADGIKAMDRKDVDLIAIDQDVYESRYRGTGKYQVFYSGFNTENYAFGVRKGSTLTDVINGYLVDMLRDGTAQNLANRFFTMDFSQKDSTIQKPVATLAPVVTAVPATCVNAMSYVADVTVKDGQTFGPNEGFRKTWRIYNNGSCTWDSNYTLQLVSGDSMNGSYVRIPTTVKPGQTIDVSADLKAPDRAGNYKGYWQMRSPQGSGFGQTIWVAIKVSGNAPAPTARPSEGQTRRIPIINYFYAADTEGHLGDGTMVYWSVSNASGVTITCNGSTIENSGNLSGAAPVNAVLQRPGVHEIKLTAHSVTDDTSSSVFYTMYDQNGNTGEGQTRVVPVIDYFYSDSDSGISGDAVTVYWGSNAAGVTLSVDGYDIVNSTGSGSYTLQAPVSGTGSHNIVLTAHTVTDDATSSITYTTYESSDYGGGTDGSDSDGEDGQTQVIPSVDYVYASPDSGNAGDGTTVYWSTTNAIGVTISVDGYTIDNSGPSGSYPLQAPVASAGMHTITVTAQSITDSASDSCTYTAYEVNNDNYSEDTYTYEMTEQDWQDFGSAVENMTEDDWNQVYDSMTEDDWNAIGEVLDQMTDEDWALLEALMGQENG